MRRRDTYFLVGFFVAIVFFAAISISINALAPDVPTTSNTAADDARVQDSTYVLVLGSANAIGIPQRELIDMGRSVCASFDGGRSRPTTEAELTSRGLTSAQAALVTKAAVDAYCPGHRGTLAGPSN